jgi:integrase
MDTKTAEQLMREKLSRMDYSYKTEQSYVGWLKRYMTYLLRHRPSGDAASKVEAFLTYLVKEHDVAASTQDIALNACLFFYKHIKKEKVGNIQALRSRRMVRKRVSPSVGQVKAILKEVRPVSGYPIPLVCRLLYGCGLRINETLSIRIKDVCFERMQIHLHGTKGRKDRFAKIPPQLADELKVQIDIATAKHAQDKVDGLPVQLERAYRMRAPSYQFSLGWYWLFPLHTPSRCRRSDRMVRWHLLDKNVQREVKRAATKLGLEGQITPHHFRHAWGTHLHDRGANIRDLQDAFGHKSIETTMNYLRGEVDRLDSPLDLIA